jgi:hypothetical protein
VPVDASFGGGQSDDRGQGESGAQESAGRDGQHSVEAEYQGHGSAKGGSGGNAKGIGVGQRIKQKSLKHGSGQGQSHAHGGGGKDSRQSNVPDHVRQGVIHFPDQIIHAEYTSPYHPNNLFGGNGDIAKAGSDQYEGDQKQQQNEGLNSGRRAWSGVMVDHSFPVVGGHVPRPCLLVIT